MVERPESGWCNAALFFDRPLVCSGCGNRDCWLADDGKELDLGEALDLGYTFDTFQSASAIARGFSAKYGHDVYVLESPGSPNVWIIATGAGCLYELMQAINITFDHVNGPGAYLGTVAKIGSSMPFDETFEKFKRMLLTAELQIMIYVDPEFPYWSIAKECSEDYEHNTSSSAA